MKDRFLNKQVSDLKTNEKIIASLFTQVNSAKHKSPRQDDGYN